MWPQLSISEVWVAISTLPGRRAIPTWQRPIHIHISKTWSMPSQLVQAGTLKENYLKETVKFPKRRAKCSYIKMSIFWPKSVSLTFLNTQLFKPFWWSPKETDKWLFTISSSTKPDHKSWAGSNLFQDKELLLLKSVHTLIWSNLSNNQMDTCGSKLITSSSPLECYIQHWTL